MDRQRRLRRGETSWRMEQRTRWTTWTLQPSVDGGRFTHNPEVAGSNPAPATNFRRSRPFSYQGEGLLRAGHCSKTCSTTGPGAARRRDGVTRDETAWTWWTLPPATSGCLARRYHRHPPVSSRPCWTSRNARSRSGVTSARRMSARGIRLPGARGAALARVQRRLRGHRGDDVRGRVLVPEPGPVQRQDPVAIEFDVVGGVLGVLESDLGGGDFDLPPARERCTIATASRSKMLRGEPTVSDNAGGREAA